MEVTPIYLTNIDLAIQMKEAGFDKKCCFNAKTDNTPMFYECIDIYFHNLCIATISNDDDFCFDVLQLPTLGEIELPVAYSVVKNTNDEWYVSYYDEPCQNHTLNTYKTELEARCYAWLWANKKEVQNGNN